jgi:hypothetical protein
MDNGKAVRVSWICEFLTEAEFGRVLPAVARTLTVLMHQLNTKWGNTNVSAFQAFLILHLAFSRGAQQTVNAKSFAFSADDFVVEEGCKATRTNPLSATATAEDEHVLSLADGKLNMVSKRRKPRATSILALNFAPMHVLLFVGRVQDLLQCGYQSQMVDRIWGDIADRTREALQQDSSDLEGVGQMLQCGFAALSKGFRTHMQRGSHTLHTFRHTITAAQLQGVMAQRTKDGLAAMKVVREQAMSAVADTARVMKELRAEVKQLKSGSPGKGKKSGAQRARDLRDQQAQAAASGAPAPGPAPSTGGVAPGGQPKGKGGRGGGKGSKGGKGGKVKWPSWLLEADRQKCTAKFGDVSYHDAMRLWFHNEDRTGMCFQIHATGIGADSCTNTSCKVCT